ncbi:MAG: SDR family NAD(P)-dependent oxidoreductase [Christensenellaceae bacterium]
MSVVLITGASRGIGRETAKLFNERGYKVAVCYKNGGRNADELKKKGIYTYKCDLTDESQIDKMIESVHREIGDIDILVNNAGIALKQQPFFDVSAEDLNAVFALNVFGTYFVTKKVVPDMIKNRGGSIVNVSSVWGTDGGSCECAYSMTKGALIAFTKSLYKELSGANVRVNCVAPGIIDTDMNARLSEDDVREFVSGYSIPRIGKASEVAKVVYFLATEEASYINGEVIKVDGGKL